MLSMDVALKAKCIGKEDKGSTVLAVYILAKGVLPAVNY